MEALSTPAMSENAMGRRAGERSGVTDAADMVFQERMLVGVSRTFALTIPQLPAPLRRAVGNAYLLCRVADTIEDDAGLTAEQKTHHLQTFIDILDTGGGVEAFARELHLQLDPSTPATERELIRECARVLRITSNLDQRQRAAIARCVTIMGRGMDRFERERSSLGLESLADHERYCYVVAGVVGEMLTDLFCSHSDRIDARREALMSWAVRFGQGLQMTNILKDVWDDLERDTCWLPRDVFSRHGFDLSQLQSRHPDSAFDWGMNEMVGIAHSCLRDALAYTLLIPRREAGIRRFLLWAIGLAVLTLRKIHRNPSFTSGAQVKVSRRTVKAVVFTASALSPSNLALTEIFSLAAGGLPAETPTSRRPKKRNHKEMMP
jgi:farnesyl-diphosphate farnesyltransferase